MAVWRGGGGGVLCLNSLSAVFSMSVSVAG